MSRFLTVIGVIMMGIVGIIVVSAVVTAPIAWVVMLLLGLANALDSTVPAFGFLVTWVLVFIARVITIQNVTPTSVTKATTGVNQNLAARKA